MMEIPNAFNNSAVRLALLLPLFSGEEVEG
jgi:hypothetical protein